MVLRSPEGMLAAIVRSADEAIIAKNLDGTIVAWNPAAEQLYGYSAEEVMGRPIDVIIPPDRPNEMRDILDRLGAGERIDHFQTVRQHKDGTLIDISVTISPIHDGDTVVGASAIARDISSERRQAERDRRHAMMVHDDIIQGLAIAKMAIEVDDLPRALAKLTSTLVAAQNVVEALLANVSLSAADVRLD